MQKHRVPTHANIFLWSLLWLHWRMALILESSVGTYSTCSNSVAPKANNQTFTRLLRLDPVCAVVQLPPLCPSLKAALRMSTLRCFWHVSSCITSAIRKLGIWPKLVVSTPSFIERE